MARKKKAEQIPTNEKAIIDLVFKCGWKFDDISTLLLGKNISADEWFANERISEYIKSIGLDPSEYDVASEVNEVEGVSKEAQILRYQIIMRNSQPGSKEWFEASKRVDDIMQVKKEENTDKKKLVHYFLPLSCHLCKLYRDEKAAREAQKSEQNKN